MRIMKFFRIDYAFVSVGIVLSVHSDKPGRQIILNFVIIFVAFARQSKFRMSRSIYDGANETFKRAFAQAVERFRSFVYNYVLRRFEKFKRIERNQQKRSDVVFYFSVYEFV